MKKIYTGIIIAVLLSALSVLAVDGNIRKVYSENGVYASASYYPDTYNKVAGAVRFRTETGKVSLQWDGKYNSWQLLEDTETTLSYSVMATDYSSYYNPTKTLVTVTYDKVTGTMSLESVKFNLVF